MAAVELQIVSSLNPHKKLFGNLSDIASRIAKLSTDNSIPYLVMSPFFNKNSLTDMYRPNDEIIAGVYKVAEGDPSLLESTFRKITNFIAILNQGESPYHDIISKMAEQNEELKNIPGFSEAYSTATELGNTVHNLYKAIVDIYKGTNIVYKKSPATLSEEAKKVVADRLAELQKKSPGKDTIEFRTLNNLSRLMEQCTSQEEAEKAKEIAGKLRNMFTPFLIIDTNKSETKKDIENTFKTEDRQKEMESVITTALSFITKRQLAITAVIHNNAEMLKDLNVKGFHMTEMKKLSDDILKVLNLKKKEEIFNPEVLKSLDKFLGFVANENEYKEEVARIVELQQIIAKGGKAGEEAKKELDPNLTREQGKMTNEQLSGMDQEQSVKAATIAIKSLNTKYATAVKYIQNNITKFLEIDKLTQNMQLDQEKFKGLILKQKSTMKYSDLAVIVRSFHGILNTETASRLGYLTINTHKVTMSGPGPSSIVQNLGEGNTNITLQHTKDIVSSEIRKVVDKIFQDALSNLTYPTIADIMDSDFVANITEDVDTMGVNSKDVSHGVLMQYLQQEFASHANDIHKILFADLKKFVLDAYANRNSNSDPNLAVLKTAKVFDPKNIMGVMTAFEAYLNNKDNSLSASRNFEREKNFYSIESAKILNSIVGKSASDTARIKTSEFMGSDFNIGIESLAFALPASILDLSDMLSIMQQLSKITFPISNKTAGFLFKSAIKEQSGTEDDAAIEGTLPYIIDNLSEIGKTSTAIHVAVSQIWDSCSAISEEMERHKDPDNQLLHAGTLASARKAVKDLVEFLLVMRQVTDKEKMLIPLNFKVGKEHVSFNFKSTTESGANIPMTEVLTKGDNINKTIGALKMMTTLLGYGESFVDKTMGIIRKSPSINAYIGAAKFQNITVPLKALTDSEMDDLQKAAAKRIIKNHAQILHEQKVTEFHTDFISEEHVFAITDYMGWVAGKGKLLDGIQLDTPEDVVATLAYGYLSTNIMHQKKEQVEHKTTEYPTVAELTTFVKDILHLPLSANTNNFEPRISKALSDKLKSDPYTSSRYKSIMNASKMIATLGSHSEQLDNAVTDTMVKTQHGLKQAEPVDINSYHILQGNNQVHLTGTQRVVEETEAYKKLFSDKLRGEVTKNGENLLKIPKYESYVNKEALDAINEIVADNSKGVIEKMKEIGSLNKLSFGVFKAIPMETAGSNWFPKFKKLLSALTTAIGKYQSSKMNTDPVYALPVIRQKGYMSTGLQIADNLKGISAKAPDGKTYNLVDVLCGVSVDLAGDKHTDYQAQQIAVQNQEDAAEGAEATDEMEQPEEAFMPASELLHTIYFQLVDAMLIVRTIEGLKDDSKYPKATMLRISTELRKLLDGIVSVGLSMIANKTMKVPPATLNFISNPTPQRRKSSLAAELFRMAVDVASRKNLGEEEYMSLTLLFSQISLSIQYMTTAAKAIAGALSSPARLISEARMIQQATPEASAPAQVEKVTPTDIIQKQVPGEKLDKDVTPTTTMKDKVNDYMKNLTAPSMESAPMALAAKDKIENKISKLN